MRMTGKEATEELLKTLKHWQGRNTIFDKMQGDCILKELEELTKYKRAFEILKSKEIFEFKDDNCLYLNAEDHNWWGDIIESSFVRLSDEEYELLEELLND
jgi:hypothetical protein